MTIGSLLSSFKTVTKPILIINYIKHTYIIKIIFNTSNQTINNLFT